MTATATRTAQGVGGVLQGARACFALPGRRDDVHGGEVLGRHAGQGEQSVGVAGPGGGHGPLGQPPPTGVLLQAAPAATDARVGQGFTRRHVTQFSGQTDAAAQKLPTPHHRTCNAGTQGQQDRVGHLGVGIVAIAARSVASASLNTSICSPVACSMGPAISSRSNSSSPRRVANPSAPGPVRPPKCRRP